MADTFATQCSIRTPNVSDWYVDNGALAHMTATSSNLDSAQVYTDKDMVVVGNGNSLPISHIGNCSITPDIDLLNVLVVPRITKNILSISQLTNDFPVNVIFSNDSFTIQNRTTRVPLARGKREGGLYVLQQVQTALLAAIKNKRLTGSFNLWHSRLGHVAHSTVSLLHKQGRLFVTSILPSPQVCSPC